MSVTTIKPYEIADNAIVLRVSNTDCGNFDLTYANREWMIESDVCTDGDDVNTYYGSLWNMGNPLWATWGNLIEDAIDGADDSTMEKLETIWNNTSPRNREELDDEWEKWVLALMQERITTTVRQITQYTMCKS